MIDCGRIHPVVTGGERRRHIVNTNTRVNTKRSVRRFRTLIKIERRTREICSAENPAGRDFFFINSYF